MFTFNRFVTQGLPKLVLILSSAFWAIPLVGAAERVGAWSPIVDGLRARLIVTDLDRDVGGNEKVRVYVEFQRSVEVWGTKSIYVSALETFDWRLTDTDGHDADKLAIFGVSILGNPEPWVELPPDSSFRMLVSDGMFSSHRGIGLQFVLANTARGWEIVRGKIYYLSGTYKSSVDSRGSGNHQALWSGKLELPGVALPDCRK